VTVTYPGFYTVKPSDPVAQGSTSGSGTGATFNMTWAAQFANSIVTNEAGVLPWQRFGASSFVSSLMAKANAYDYARSLVTYGSGTSLSNATKSSNSYHDAKSDARTELHLRSHDVHGGQLDNDGGCCWRCK
jgi:hypothetical protein